MPTEKHPALNLPREERADYLSVLACLAAADGTASDSELKSLQAGCEVLDLEKAETERVIQAAREPESVDVQSALGRLRGSELRYTLLADLFYLAHADDAFTEAERGEIVHIANATGIGAPQASAVETYVIAARQGKATPENEAALTAVGIPVAALQAGAFKKGLSTKAAIGIGAGAVAVGVGGFFAVRWLYRKLKTPAVEVTE